MLEEIDGSAYASNLIITHRIHALGYHNVPRKDVWIVCLNLKTSSDSFLIREKQKEMPDVGR